MDNKGEHPTPEKDANSTQVQPANPSRRKWGVAALAALAGVIGLKKAAGTETGQNVIQSVATNSQKIMDAAPWNPASDRPTLSKQMEETQRNLDAQDPTKRGKLPPDPTQESIEKKIKAELDANSANRYQTPTPTQKK